MSKAKTRNFLVKCHLWAAGLLAPLFILVAYTGAAYLLDYKGEVKETPLAVPAGTALDPESPTVEADVRSILAANQLDVDFDYLRMGDNSITTRPTSRDFVSFERTDGTWTATLNQPDLQYALIELHKGHGPALYRYYQILAAVVLFLVVLGGLIVGWMAPAYRRATGIGLGAGTVVFGVLAFVL
ncbi:PepSY domain-containing protein [Parerythrobacter aurantius]|uniref:PepSY domain-containing protein n=1 Tax=Parerythrobacter aurantius TaxID=3127706 RepID=UPI0032460BE7